MKKAYRTTEQLIRIMRRRTPAGKGEPAITGNTLTVQIPEKLKYPWLRAQ